MFHSRISLANWAIKLKHTYKNRINYITYHHISSIYTAGVFYLGTVFPEKPRFFLSCGKKNRKAKQNHLSYMISPTTLTGFVKLKALVNFYKCCFLNILIQWLKLKFKCFSKYPIPTNSNFQSHELYKHLWIFWLTHFLQLPIPLIPALQWNTRPHNYATIHSTQCTRYTQPSSVILPVTQSFGHQHPFDKGLALWTNSARKN